MDHSLRPRVPVPDSILIEDSRSFALADIDHDGRLEVILKNRNAPQIRILHNTMKSHRRSDQLSIARPQEQPGRNGRCHHGRDSGELKQTKYLQAGSGFLAQHCEGSLLRDRRTLQRSTRATGSLAQRP
jgi:hypothetical protein